MFKSNRNNENNLIFFLEYKIYTANLTMIEGFMFTSKNVKACMKYT